MKPLVAALALFAAFVAPAVAHADVVDASAAGVPIVADAAPAVDALPVVDVQRLAGAFGAKDWQVCVAALLGLIAFAIRRLTPETNFAHTRAGAAVITVLLAFLGAIVPQLSAHASWVASLVTGALAAVMALAAMATPRAARSGDLVGEVPEDRVVDDPAKVAAPEGMSAMCLFPGCPARVTGSAFYCDAHPGGRASAAPIVAWLALLLPLAASGCASFAAQPVALQRAERDLFGCAMPAVQSAIVKFAPVAIDALTGDDTNWRAALVDLEREGVNATVCTVAHLLYDALGVEGVKAIAAGDLERAVEKQLLLADASGGPPLADPPHRRVLRRGLVVLQEARQSRAREAR